MAIESLTIERSMVVEWSSRYREVVVDVVCPFYEYTQRPKESRYGERVVDRLDRANILEEISCERGS